MLVVLHIYGRIGLGLSIVEEIYLSLQVGLVGGMDVDFGVLIFWIKYVIHPNQKYHIFYLILDLGGKVALYIFTDGIMSKERFRYMMDIRNNLNVREGA